MSDNRMKKLNRVEAKQAVKRLNKHIEIHSMILKRYDDYLNTEIDTQKSTKIKTQRKYKAA